MTLLGFLRNRKGNRKQDPFLAEPAGGYLRGPGFAAAPPRFANPRGVATEETLAGIVAQAQARVNGHDWYGHDTTAMDVPPAHERPYVPAPPPPPAFSPPPPMPFSGVSEIMVSRVDYPDPADLSCDKDRHYRETLRRMGAATGTSTSLEDTGTWPRLALEPGDGTGVRL
jgi:hypothetical protein